MNGRQTSTPSRGCEGPHALQLLRSHGLQRVGEESLTGPAQVVNEPEDRSGVNNSIYDVSQTFGRTESGFGSTATQAGLPELCGCLATAMNPELLEDLMHVVLDRG